MIRGIFNFQEKCKTSRIRFGESFEVPEFERELDFDPGNVVVHAKQSWVTISLATCVDAESVLDGEGLI